MTYSKETRLIKCDVQTDDIKGKWKDFMDGGNGYLYGIPSNARRVAEYNVKDNNMKEIGPDLGVGWGNKYENGIKANNGSIYCVPNSAEYI